MTVFDTTMASSLRGARKQSGPRIDRKKQKPRSLVSLAQRKSISYGHIGM